MRILRFDRKTGKLPMLTRFGLILAFLSLAAAGQATPTVNAVLNGASFASGELAPGTIVSIFGVGLASGEFVPNTLPLPTQAGGTSVRVAGQALALFYLSPTQINAQLPFGLTPGPAVLTVRDNAGEESSINVVIAEATPGIFSLTADGTGEAIATHTDFSLVQRGIGVNATEGEAIVLFCTGLGDVVNAPPPGAPSPSDPLATTQTQPQVLMDGRPAQVLFAGLAPGFVGLYQINLVVPNGVGGDVVTVIRSGSATSNEVTINVAGTFFVHPRYAGPLVARAGVSESPTIPKSLLAIPKGSGAEFAFFDASQVGEFGYRASYTISDGSTVLDSGSFEFEATIPMTGVLNSDFEGSAAVVMDTLDAGESFLGVLYEVGGNPEDWVLGFEVGNTPPPPPAPSPDVLPGFSSQCSALEGALIFADDGTFLGVITANSFLQESIGNEFGPYGSRFSRTSIFNEFGPYGGDFGSQSAFNEFASRPPVIVINGQAVAFLTTNQFKTPRVDTRVVAACIGR